MAKASGRIPQNDERDGDEARQRLALTRVLIWAEREATALERPDVSELLKEAIAALHKPR